MKTSNIFALLIFPVLLLATQPPRPQERRWDVRPRHFVRGIDKDGSARMDVVAVVRVTGAPRDLGAPQGEGLTIRRPTVVPSTALTPDGSRTVVTTQGPTRTLTVDDTFLGARLSWEPMDPRFAIKWLEPGTGARTLAFGRNDGISGLAQF